jgi:eukaryotic-like serine/threonine-protein kinase
VARKDDEEFYFRAVPRLPFPLVEQLINERPDEFDVILRAYNGHIEGGLPFEYCDVVANFYRRIFQKTSDLDHKRLILTRLIDLGADHNRWHVGGVVAGLLTELTEPSEISMAAEVIRADPVHARWFEGYIANRAIPSAVKSAFNSLRPSPADDDIPF